MPATQRIVVTTTAADKARIAQRAKALGVSMSDYLRQAEASFEPDQAEAARTLARQAGAAIDRFEVESRAAFAVIDALGRRTDANLATPSPLDAYLEPMDGIARAP